jgi:hypothetical protein
MAEKRENRAMIARMTRMTMTVKTNAQRSQGGDPSRKKTEDLDTLVRSTRDGRTSTRTWKGPGIVLALGQDRLKSDD